MVFSAAMFYDQFAATPEEHIAGNLVLPHRRHRAHNMIWLFVFHFRLRIHIRMMVIRITPVKCRSRKG